MISLSVKTHWRLALRAVKMAIKVTVNELINRIKLTIALNKRSDVLFSKRQALITMERCENE